MTDKQMTIKITPQFGLEIGLALINYAGVELTGKMVGKKDKSIEKAQHFSDLANAFTNEVTQFMIDNNLPHNPELDKLCLDYMMSSLTYRSILSSLNIDTDAEKGENE